jgi:hypothetical protein
MLSKVLLRSVSSEDPFKTNILERSVSRPRFSRGFFPD